MTEHCKKPLRHSADSGEILRTERRAGMKYRFDHAEDGAVFVPPEKLYMLPEDENEERHRKTAEEDISGEAGRMPEYGFLTEENRPLARRLTIPELNSGFDVVYWGQGQKLTRLAADDSGVGVEWKGEGELPLTFAADVPSEGNYLVRVTLYSDRPKAEAMLFLGRRRLAWRGLLEEAGEHRLGAFVTNICPIIPRTYEEPMEDLTLDVTVVGRDVSLVSAEIEPWSGRTLYIAGDSTVTDQSADYPYLPSHSYCGWGQMISAFLGTQFAVSNHAHSGLTTESFREEGHYAILYERLREGDLCLVQFGHNDQKLMHLMAEDGYRRNLIRFIEEIRGKGAVPVLVTPLARNSWRGDDGVYNDLLAPYADACIRLAEEYDVPLLDLHKKSMEFVMECGRERAMRYFFPGDYTHSNDYGAYRYAGYVFEELVRVGLAEAASAGNSMSEDGAASGGVKTGNAAAFDSTVSENAAVSGNVTAAGSYPAWEPPEELPQLIVPEEFAGIENPADEHLFEALERTEELLTRVEALELVIEAMHFFPTNVYNDMFEDVIGHERYAGAVECAWQNGLIPENMVENHCFFPQRSVTGTEFYQIVKNGYKSRRTWTDACEQILSEIVDSKERIRRGEAAEFCRRLVRL